MFLLIAAIILCCAAFADGYTTWSGVKNNKLVEVNPLFVKLYGTDKPGAVDEFVYGFLIVAGENIPADRVFIDGTTSADSCQVSLIY
jgi:hypothetical protein